MTPIDHDVQRTTFAAAGWRAKAQRLVTRLLDRHRLAASLFIGEGGALKPEAVRWFAELAAANFVDSGTYHDDAREHARREGRRELAMEIMRSARLDRAKLARLQAQLREAE